MQPTLCAPFWRACPLTERLLRQIQTVGTRGESWAFWLGIRPGRDWRDEVCRTARIDGRSRKAPRRILLEAVEAGLVRVFDDRIWVTLVPATPPDIAGCLDPSIENSSTFSCKIKRREELREAERAREVEVPPEVETRSKPTPFPPKLDNPVQLADASGETRLRAGFRRRLRERLGRGLTAHECRTLATMAALVGPQLDALQGRQGRHVGDLAEELLERFFADPKASAARWRPGWIAWRPEEYLPALKAPPPVAPVWQPPPTWAAPSEGPPPDFAAALAALRRKARVAS